MIVIRWVGFVGLYIFEVLIEEGINVVVFDLFNNEIYFSDEKLFNV